MGELTRWQPMVSLYTYFTDCPRKEGGPSMGSVSQYESTGSAEKIAFQGQKEAPGAVARRLPELRVRTRIRAELGTVPGPYCSLLWVLFPTAGQAHPRLPRTSALLLTSHAPSSRRCFQHIQPHTETLPQKNVKDVKSRNTNT